MQNLLDVKDGIYTRCLRNFFGEAARIGIKDLPSNAFAPDGLYFGCASGKAPLNANIRHTMKPWLRLTLITATVGGGFTGVAVTLQYLFAGQCDSLGAYALTLGLLAIFAFITASGLVFVHNPERTGLMIVSLALQIPWVSSPIIAYKLAAGLQLSVALIDTQLAAGLRLGSDFQVNLFQQLPWGAGLNLFALLLLVLLLNARKMPDSALNQTSAPAIAQASENSTSSASAQPPAGNLTEQA